MKIGIVGLGLIGGSMAIDLKRKGFAQKVMGVEADPVNASAAKQIGLVDEIVSLEECVAESDIVVLAVPVGAAVKLLPQVLDSYQKAQAEDKVVIRSKASHNIAVTNRRIVFCQKSRFSSGIELIVVHQI